MKGKLRKKISLASLGIATISVPFFSTSCVYPNKFEAIGVTDSKIFFTSNNWLLTSNSNGREVMTTYPGGAYIKVAFFGNTIGIDAYCASSFPTRITLSCYIDGSDKPIVTSLSNALGNILIFSNNLKDLPDSQPHTAKIVVNTIKQEDNQQNRFVWPDELVVQNILIQKNKTLVDPSTVVDPKYPTDSSIHFKRDKNVLIYGDDYIEAQDVGSNLESNALLWEQYGYEYSIVAWTGAFVSQSNGNIYAPQFFDPTSNERTFWNQFSLGYSRVKWKDDKFEFNVHPDLIVLNLGMNDALNGVSPSIIANDVSGDYGILGEWIKFLFDNYGKDQVPPIILQMPYLFDNSHYVDYRNQYVSMYKRLCEDVEGLKLWLMDMSEGADIVTFYQSPDKIHPNSYGYGNLKKLMQSSLTPTAPLDFNASQNPGSNQINVTWSQNVQSQSYQINPIITHYIVEYKLSDSESWQENAPIPFNPNAVSSYSSTISLGDTPQQSTNYIVRMRAFNQLTGVYSSYTNEINVPVVEPT